jgi:hypothetical protein
MATIVSTSAVLRHLVGCSEPDLGCCDVFWDLVSSGVISSYWTILLLHHKTVLWTLLLTSKSGIF